MPSFRVWFKGSLIAGMFVAGLLAATLLIPLGRALLGRGSKRWRDTIVVTWSRIVCQILEVRITTSGHPDPDASLMVSNHVSWLDIIAIGSRIPCQFVSKEDVAHWPIVGIIAKGIGTLFIRRGDARQSSGVTETMAWLLKRGYRLAIFPEGTTSRGESVLRFHSKLFWPAELADVKVQALSLSYRNSAKSEAPFIDDDEFLPHLLRILSLPSIDLHLTYCDPIKAGLGYREISKKTREQILETLTPSLSLKAQPAELLQKRHTTFTQA